MRTRRLRVGCADYALWAQSFGIRMERLEKSLYGHLWLVVVFVLGLWACAHQGRIGSTQFINVYFDEKRFPLEAAESIASRGIKGPIFSLDYWGGYLITGFILRPRLWRMIAMICMAMRSSKSF